MKQRSSKKWIRGWAGIARAKSSICNFAEFSTLNYAANCIPRGSGLSYGDSALIDDGYVLSSEDTVIEILPNLHARVSGNIQIIQLLNFLNPLNRTLSVVPGTALATIGGCIANDVHGKNHFKQGSFSNQVISFTILNPHTNESLVCSKEENFDLFQSTFGGCGLTGFITEVILKTVAFQPQVQVKKTYFSSGSDLLQKMINIADNQEYLIGLCNWNRKNFFGELIVANSINSNNYKPISQPRNLLAFRMPFVTSYTDRCRRMTEYFRSSKTSITPISKFLFMADSHKNANLWFGKKGFIEYQIVLPHHNAQRGLEILQKIAKTSYIFLSGIKLFGDVENYPLSFPITGVTFTATIKPSNEIYLLLNEIDVEVAQLGGKVYLAKDHRLKKENFNSMYKDKKFIEETRRKHNLNKVNSDLSIRLGIM